jgi:hypothetical protein
LNHNPLSLGHIQRLHVPIASFFSPLLSKQSKCQGNSQGPILFTLFGE